LFLVPIIFQVVTNAHFVPLQTPMNTGVMPNTKTAHQL